MNWPLRTVGEVADVQGGLQVTAVRASLPLVRPYLRVANVLRDRVQLDEVKNIHLTSSELERVKLVRDDLLVVEGHGNPKEVGRVAIWSGSISECVHQNHLIRVRCSDAVEPNFLAAFLNSDGGRRVLTSKGKTTSGLSTISVSNVKRASIMLPPLFLQKSFSDRATKMQELVRRQDQAAKQEQALTISLSRNLMG
jgi:type I restriction enzyme S subunit